MVVPGQDDGDSDHEGVQEGNLTITRRFLGAGVAMSELALRLTLINTSMRPKFDQDNNPLKCAGLILLKP